MGGASVSASVEKRSRCECAAPPGYSDVANQLQYGTLVRWGGTSDATVCVWLLLSKLLILLSYYKIALLVSRVMSNPPLPLQSNGKKGEILKNKKNIIIPGH